MAANIWPEPKVTASRKKREDDGRHYPSRPVVGVGVVVWRDDQVLLARRGKPPMQGQWALPGGMQRLGETIMETAVREVREETGLEIRPLGIVTALDAIAHDDEGRIEYHYTLVEVTAECDAGDGAARDDITDLRWVSPDAVETLCDWPEVARIVRLAMLQRVL